MGVMKVTFHRFSILLLIASLGAFGATKSVSANSLNTDLEGVECLKEQEKLQILADDGWNYRCTRSGSEYRWSIISCVHEVCIQKPSISMKPVIGNLYLFPYAVIIEITTSSGAFTKSVFEVSIDSEFNNIVFVSNHNIYYEPSWRCAERPCGNGYYFDGSTPGLSKFYGVAKLTGVAWVRLHVVNAKGEASFSQRIDFGGPQMSITNALKPITSTSVPISSPTISTFVPSSTIPVAEDSESASLAISKSKNGKTKYSIKIDSIDGNVLVKMVATSATGRTFVWNVKTNKKGLRFVGTSRSLSGYAVTLYVDGQEQDTVNIR